MDVTTEPNEDDWVKIKWGSKEGYIKIKKLSKYPCVIRKARSERKKIRTYFEDKGFTPKYNSMSTVNELLQSGALAGEIV